MTGAVLLVVLVLLNAAALEYTVTEWRRLMGVMRGD